MNWKPKLYLETRPKAIPRDGFFFAQRRTFLKFATVSGIFTTKPNLIEWVDKNIPEIKIITTKSYQTKPNKGNREPIIVESEIGSFINAVGLRNPGMEVGFRELLELREKRNLRALLNVSLSANTINDFILLIKKFEEVADMFELNFSCPHADNGYGASIGSDKNLVFRYMNSLRQITNKPLYPKLTPNVDSIGEIALCAINAGANGIVAVNTIGPINSPILSKKYGGKSGEWIKEIALKKVKEIRTEIGNGIPIIGMGGVSTTEDALKMEDAGADFIGIGSALIRLKSQEIMPDFFFALNNKKDVKKYFINDFSMEYKKYKIKNIKRISDILAIFTLNGTIDFSSSQFVFLQIPDIGEKPFSILSGNPIKFLIRKRGIFTEALFDKKVGESIFLRGPYGKQSPKPNKKKVCIVAGGTGFAIVPKLLEEIKEAKVFLGLSRDGEEKMTSIIDKEILVVKDNGKPARILDFLEGDENTCFYNIGSKDFMEKAVKKEKNLGATEIYICLENNTMCGIGVCGECECNGKTLCKSGTFVKSFNEENDLTEEKLWEEIFLLQEQIKKTKWENVSLRKEMLDLKTKNNILELEKIRFEEVLIEA